jgi:hypothetical protein
MLEIDLIHLTFRRIHTLAIILYEMQISELNTSGWRIYLSTRPDQTISIDIVAISQNILIFFVLLQLLLCPVILKLSSSSANNNRTVAQSCSSRSNAGRISIEQKNQRSDANINLSFQNQIA